MSVPPVQLAPEMMIIAVDKWEGLGLHPFPYPKEKIGAHSPQEIQVTQLGEAACSRNQDQASALPPTFASWSLASWRSVDKRHLPGRTTVWGLGR